MTLKLPAKKGIKLALIEPFVPKLWFKLARTACLMGWDSLYNGQGKVQFVTTSAIQFSGKREKRLTWIDLAVTYAHLVNTSHMALRRLLQNAIMIDC